MNAPTIHDAPSPRLLPRLLTRLLILILLPVVAVMVVAPVVVAAPRNPDQLPPAMRKYIPGSQEWNASPWMTAPSCRNTGGDFSLWVVNMLSDSPDLLTFFNAEVFGTTAPGKTQARNDAILAGYRRLASEMRDEVPSGYCVNDMKRWVGQASLAGPFGFTWGTENTTIFSCVDGGENGSPAPSGISLLGADRAPCDGFRIRCDGATDSDRSRCEAWNAFSDRYVARVHEIRASAINSHPAVGTGTVVEKTPTTLVVLTVASALAIAGAAVGLLIWRRRRHLTPAEEKGVSS